MKLAIIGGTGAMGRGLARHLSKAYEVRVGSRTPSSARMAEGEAGTVEVMGNPEAASWCDSAIVTLPYGAIGLARDLSGPLEGKLVVSTINPVTRVGKVFQYASPGISAAERLAAELPRSMVATAFNYVPAAYFDAPFAEGVDVLVAAASVEAYESTAAIVRTVPKMRPFYVGPLTQAESVERMTVMVYNAARLSAGPGFGVKLVR